MNNAFEQLAVNLVCLVLFVLAQMVARGFYLLLRYYRCIVLSVRLYLTNERFIFLAASHERRSIYQTYRILRFHLLYRYNRIVRNSDAPTVSRYRDILPSIETRDCVTFASHPVRTSIAILF